VAPLLDQLDEIRQRGFAVVPDVVPFDQVVELRELLETCIAEDLRRWSGNPFYNDEWMVHNLMLRGLPFARLLENQKLHGYFSELLSPYCTIYAYTSSSMPPRGKNFSYRVHVDAPLVIDGYWTNLGAIVALDDFTPENGATYFLPGSFTRREQPGPEEFFAHAVQTFPRAGDAVLFNARTWHSGGANLTDRARHAVTMNVCRHFMRQRFDYPRMVGDDILAVLGPTGRRFLGFDVRVPTSLEEYYVPPEERLYKPGQW
jgi:hypothetical protein